MRVLPFFVCGLVLILLPGQSTAGHAQVLAWTVLFAALASTIDGAFRIVSRDPDPDAGTRFAVLVAAALGAVAGCGHAQLWLLLTRQTLLAALATVLATLELVHIAATATAGGPRECAERLRAAGWLRPVAAFLLAELAGGWLLKAPSFAVVIVTLWGSAWLAKVHGLDPDYVPGDGEADVSGVDPGRGGEVRGRMAHAPRATARPASGASGGGEVAADALPDAGAHARPVAPARPVMREPAMPLAPSGEPAFARDAMPAIPECPLCAQPVLAHVLPCRECGAVEHPACAGSRCSVCGMERAGLPRRAA